MLSLNPSGEVYEASGMVSNDSGATRWRQVSQGMTSCWYFVYRPNSAIGSTDNDHGSVGTTH
ncbi:MAG: hypothetical protein HC934_09355 [Acaryochloridaceae cyanobacterium SU_2_1]|nr:hypothetical protein [Acaryochloridaceae cyanobacterium SU_2_1]